MLAKYILSVLIWLPIIGGAALLAVGDDGDARSARAGLMRFVALAVSVLTFIFSVGLYGAFDNAAAGMQFVERVSWVDR